VGKRAKERKKKKERKKSLKKTLAYVFSCFLQNCSFDHVVGGKSNKHKKRKTKLKGNRLKEAF
jgi:dolichol kinase